MKKNYLRPDSSEPEEKPKHTKRNRVIDFPDHNTKEVFGPRWHTTAYLLDLRFHEQAIGYGEIVGGEEGSPKIRYEFGVEGSVKAVEEFYEFVDKTLGLVHEKWPEPDIDPKLLKKKS